MLWQLKKISTGEALNDPQLLPENWNGIFGLEGFKERLHDLSWVGLNDQGWFEVPGELPVAETSTSALTPSEFALQRALQLLQESDWTMLSDISHTREKKIQWIEYRAKLRDIEKQAGFPDTIAWPTKP